MGYSISALAALSFENGSQLPGIRKARLVGGPEMQADVGLEEFREIGRGLGPSDGFPIGLDGNGLYLSFLVLDAMFLCIEVAVGQRLFRCAGIAGRDEIEEMRDGLFVVFLLDELIASQLRDEKRELALRATLAD